MSKLIFKLGESYVIREEKIEDFNESIFKDIYVQSYHHLYEIKKKKNENYNNFNNIIAYVGDRGTGKTSCMVSLAKSLIQENKTKELRRVLLDSEIAGEIEEGSWILSKVIDPSHLTENSNILEIILGEVFREFKKELENKKQNYKSDIESNKRKILNLFSDIYDNLKTMSMGKKEIFKGEGIEVFLKLASSSELEEKIEKLIKTYFEFRDEKNGMFVIQIDDIDLNTEYAFEMVEQIRKYLIIPDVVILMAVNIEQLSEIISHNYVKKFKELLDKKMMDITDINEMTDKYLEKLIPIDRRNMLPDVIDDFNNIELIIEN